LLEQNEKALKDGQGQIVRQKQMIVKLDASPKSKQSETELG
jgi:hypothetical protein